MPVFQDLTGQAFDQLTVLGQGDRGPSGQIRWDCQCTCGNRVAVRTAALRNGHTRSCGCLREVNKGGRPTRNGRSRAYTRVWYIYQYAAKKRNREFALSEQEFDKLISSNCTYCGVPPSQKTHYSETFYYNGIDRIDNNLGYVSGNVVTSCHTCNQAKHKMTEAEFREWIQRLITFNSRV